MSDKPLNDEFNALDADMAETNAEHGLDADPSDNLAPLDAVIAERDEWKDRALRVAAEMENLKRRSEAQQNDARAYAIQRFAKDLLGVADNLERALQAAPKDASCIHTHTCRKPIYMYDCNIRHTCVHGTNGKHTSDHKL